jgi:hypothetical protein
MAFEPMTSVADGDYLSAAWLNRLKNNIEHLYGISNYSNSGFVVRQVDDSDYSNDVRDGWSIMHLSNSLRIVYSVSGLSDYIYVRMNNIRLTPDLSNVVGIHDDIIDISAHGFTVGQIYDLSVTIRAQNTHSATCVIHYIGQEL